MRRSTRPRLAATLLATVLVLSATSAFSQSPPPLEEAHRAKLVGEIAELLDEVYVFPDVAQEMIDLIERKQAAGDYRQFDRLNAFTEQLTSDLQSISHDKHLNVLVGQPENFDRGDQALTPEEQEALFAERMKSRNYGFQHLELLPGNIAYLDLRGFVPAEYGGPTAVAAMNFMANASAIIFDLRRNGGGSPSMIQLITSYLFEDRQHLNTFYVRRSDTTQQFWTQEMVLGPKMPDTPVYILTSPQTFSAAEEFTYNLKHMERATVVGETTGGGAHPVDFANLALGDGHYAQVTMPFGRAINPITGTNWEGTGVAPHIETPTEQALVVARIEIMKQLEADTQDEHDRFALDWAMAELQFELDPDAIPLDGAGAYAGHFGPREVFVEDEKLYYRRGAGPAHELQPMNADGLFHVGDLDNFRLQFERDANGQVSALVGQYDNGRQDRHPRGGMSG
jgi:hypothetical protein